MYRVAVSWDAFDAAYAVTGVSVRDRAVGGEWYSWTDLAASATSTSLLLSASKLRVYEIEVRAKNAHGVGEVGSVTFDPATPPTPVNLEAEALPVSSTDVNGASVRLGWDLPPVPYKHWQRRHRASGAAAWTAWEQFGDSSTDEVEVSGLRQGTEYEFEVRAYDGGETAGSAEGAGATTPPYTRTTCWRRWQRW